MPSPTTKTKQHRWTRMTYVPIQVAGFGDDGAPIFLELGEPLAGFNCFDCGAPLNQATEHAECTGKGQPTPE